jgi:hypothetical protein
MVSFLKCNEFRGIKVGKDLHVQKFRFNQQFRLINAEEFLKQLLNDPQVQANFLPICNLGTCNGLTFKQVNCQILNMSYFDYLEEIGIINDHNGSIKGCFDEWFEGMQLGNKLRTALAWEEDENYETLQ